MVWTRFFSDLIPCPFAFWSRFVLFPQKSFESCHFFFGPNFVCQISSHIGKPSVLETTCLCPLFYCLFLSPNGWVPMVSSSYVRLLLFKWNFAQTFFSCSETWAFKARKWQRLWNPEEGGAINQSFPWDFFGGKEIYRIKPWEETTSSPPDG